MPDDPEEQATEPVSCAILEPPKPEETRPALQPGRNPAYPNLLAPWKKGEPNPGSRKGPKKLSLRSLEQWIRKELASKNGRKMEALAKAIIDGAIAREPACLNWLGDRLWKAEQGAEQGRVVIQGIRLELPNPSSTKGLEPLEAPILSVSTSVGTDVREES